jgi:predicted nucleotidyltransferase
MSARDFLHARRAERDILLERATALLMDDARVVAAWLFGSLGREDADDLSDIDLRVVVADRYSEAINATRREYVERLGKPLLIEEAPGNAPVGGAYLLVLYDSRAGLQHVDWTWQPQSHAQIPHEARVLFDRIGIPPIRAPESITDTERAARVTERVIFFWAMSPIAAKFVARRQRRSTLTMISMIERALHDVQWLVGTRNSVPDFKDNRTDPPPVEPADQLETVRALAREMETLAPRIVASGATIPTESIPEIYRFFDLVGAMLVEGTTAKSASESLDNP